MKFKGCHFKIGKTTQPLNDRFRQEYEKDYFTIAELYRSTDKQLIDWLEKTLISHFMTHNHFIFDNDQRGGGYPAYDANAQDACVYLALRN